VHTAVAAAGLFNTACGLDVFPTPIIILFNTPTMSAAMLSMLFEGAPV
jgi:hypothetical protein